jgi:hypothetical protein
VEGHGARVVLQEPVNDGGAGLSVQARDENDGSGHGGLLAGMLQV